jgi:hypothetical protein
MKFRGKNLASPVKGGADADLGATGGDGGSEVAAHAHGEFAQRDLKTGGEVVGNGGLVAWMLRGLALLALTVRGTTLYWRLADANKQGRTGLQRWFF